MSQDIAILSSHLSTLIEARSVSQNELDPLVSYAILETQEGRSTETRRAQWEYLLKTEVFKLATTEGDSLKVPDTRYFDELKSRLDLILAFTEHDVTDASFPFSVLEDLLETQTIASCWHIFSWMEDRKERLTINMVSGKGKALVLLRTLNDLLRRVSKTGTGTMFCGRILNFMSSVYPLGERSGVNLRGDYGPQWEEVKPKKERATSEGEPSLMDEDKRKSEDKKEEFYQTFWWLQIPFSRPPLFAHVIPLEKFKKAVTTVLPVISEATRKDQAKMGSKAVGNLKRKREPVVENTSNDFFSAKFLTSPELLDYELADTNFRRQILFQLLILLQHLLHFTPAEKAKWATTRNRSLQMDFTLSEADVKWAKETWTKVTDELKATSPNGKAVADTVAIILERENNWIRWKEDLCTPFDKDPLQPPLEEQTRVKRQKMSEPPPPWRYKCGSESLTEIWETGFHSLKDCEDMPSLPDIKYYAKQQKLMDSRIALRKRQLDQMRPSLPTPVAAAIAATADGEPSTTNITPLDPAIAKTEGTTAPAPVQAIVAPTAVPTAPTPVPALAPPLHPSLPPRPVVSPAPFSKTQNGRSTVSAAPTPAPVPAEADATPSSKIAAPLPKIDERLAEFNEQKNRLAWLALRRGRTEYLHLFEAKIGAGDIDSLVMRIEEEKEKGEQKEQKEKEKRLKEKAASTLTEAEKGNKVKESEADEKALVVNMDEDQLPNADAAIKQNSSSMSALTIEALVESQLSAEDTDGKTPGPEESTTQSQPKSEQNGTKMDVD